ncbi:Tetratricopeptide domain-contaning protein [Candidatus Megaera venefica]|uniref:Tetratricopeptide domain-contaning protein n=1 Tax=Candidatus Megaera venefica TaxID=2055910 RepID=A0ABU5NCG3_9RICK|nr:Tetratricopeptide domain-contaning protein [Candidatus Megaera venefica]
MQATQIQPDHILYNSALGTAYLQLKSYPKAIEYLTKAISNVPNSDTEYNQYLHGGFNSKLGEAYWNFGKPSEAIECLTKATQYQPKNPEYRNNLNFVQSSGASTQVELEVQAAATEILLAGTGEDQNSDEMVDNNL